MDEELDHVGLHIVGDFNLEEVRGVVDDQSHLGLESLVYDGFENVLNGFW
jgi:hypothetical protein